MTAKVYVAMATDMIHHGHIKIMEEARKLGEVTVGILTDKAIAAYRRVPLTSLEQRKSIVSNIKGVKNTIEQETLDYTDNLLKIRPEYVVHGDDWSTGVQRKIREKVIETLKEWDGKLVEVPYSDNVEESVLAQDILNIGTTPDARLKKLRRLIELKPLVRVLEAHNGLTGRIVEETKLVNNGFVKEFDAMWESSLTDSTSKGKPDTQAVDFTSRFQTIEQILEVTTKPMIVDGDNGGMIEHFGFTVRTLERLGVSAIIIEDKIGFKQNSLFGTEVQQSQDTVENFCKKIEVGKLSQVTSDFMVIARIESLILKSGLEDALKRSRAYIDAGADAIMIHSKEKDPSEILSFCEEYNKLDNKVPLVVVPSTYNMITEAELIKAGVKIVIYANHLLRSAYPAMRKTAETILEQGRSHETNELCMPIKDILTLIPKAGEVKPNDEV